VFCFFTVNKFVPFPSGQGSKVPVVEEPHLQNHVHLHNQNLNCHDDPAELATPSAPPIIDADFSLKNEPARHGSSFLDCDGWRSETSVEQKPNTVVKDPDIVERYCCCLLLLLAPLKPSSGNAFFFSLFAGLCCFPLALPFLNPYQFQCLFEFKLFRQDTTFTQYMERQHPHLQYYNSRYCFDFLLNNYQMPVNLNIMNFGQT
jgi:hypothetical protein